jgi:hypothetical protein
MCFARGGRRLMLIWGLVFVFDIMVVYLACHSFGIEYVDIWRALFVVVFSWLIGILLLPFLIISLIGGAGGSLLGPWLGVLFSSLCIFIAVKYVMMIDWSVAAKISAVYLVYKILLKLLFAAMGR